MFSSKKEPLSHPSSVFIHISNDSVAAGIGVHIDKDHFQIDYVTRKSIHLDAESTKEHLFSAVGSALNEILADIAKHAAKSFLERRHHIKEVFVGISSPWYISKSFSINVSKKEPFVVTKKGVEDILSKEINRFVKEVNEGVYKGFIDGEFMLHEQNVVSTALNGYKTTNPYGKKTSSLSMNVSVSLFAKDFVEKVTHIIESHIVFKNITFHSFPFLCGMGVTKLFSNESTAFLVHLTEHTTDISYMKNGVLENTASIPLGMSDMIDRISRAINTQPHITYSLLRTFSESMLSSVATEKIKASANLTRDEWLAYIHKVEKDLVGNDVMPTKVFFTSPTGTLVLCEMFLKEHFAPVSLDNEKTSSFVHHSPFVGKDPSVSIIALGSLL